MIQVWRELSDIQFQEKHSCSKELVSGRLWQALTTTLTTADSDSDNDSDNDSDYG